MVSNKLLTHKSYIMKKVLFFATCAIALLAGCQKTEINYDGEPQEIAFFAVNKTATKAPVTGTAFKDSDEINREFIDKYKIDLYIPGCPTHPLTFINAILDFIRKIYLLYPQLFFLLIV